MSVHIFWLLWTKTHLASAMLVKEVLVDVLKFLDFSSLLRLKFTDSMFRSAVLRDEQQLAKQLEFTILVKSNGLQLCNGIKLRNSDSAEEVIAIDCDELDLEALSSALLAADTAVGLHPIDSVFFSSKLLEAVERRELRNMPAAAWCASSLSLTDMEGAHLRPTLTSMIGRFYRFLGLQRSPDSRSSALTSFIERFSSLDDLRLSDVSPAFDWNLLTYSCFLRSKCLEIASNAYVLNFDNSFGKQQICASYSISRVWSRNRPKYSSA